MSVGAVATSAHGDGQAVTGGEPQHGGDVVGVTTLGYHGRWGVEGFALEQPSCGIEGLVTGGEDGALEAGDGSVKRPGAGGGCHCSPSAEVTR